MSYKDRPVGIWFICVIFFGMAIYGLYVFSITREIFDLVVDALGSMAISIGLFTFTNWIRLAVLIFYSVAAVVVIGATIFFVIANFSYDYLLLISRLYWHTGLELLFAFWCIYYLRRKEVKKLFMKFEEG
jgi:hypothetical protein